MKVNTYEKSIVFLKHEYLILNFIFSAVLICPPSHCYHQMFTESQSLTADSRVMLRAGNGNQRDGPCPLFGLTPVNSLIDFYRKQRREQDSEAEDDSVAPRRKPGLSNFMEQLRRTLEIPQAMNKSSSGIYLYFQVQGNPSWHARTSE